MVKGKKINLKINKNFKTNVSVVDVNNPSVVHFKITSWVELISDIENEESFIRRFNKEVKQFLFSYLNNHGCFKQKYIVDLDMSASSLKNRGKCFFECDVTLVQKGDLLINDKELNENVNKILNVLIQKVFLPKKEFKYHLTRKF